MLSQSTPSILRNFPSLPLHKRYPRTRTYRSWDSMKQRCLNPQAHGYHNYGGRGITVCERWLDYTYFLEDMGVRPENTSLDRIDNSKGYSKENCRWSTPKEQRINSRTYKHGKILYYEFRTDSRKHWKAVYIKEGISKSKIFLTREEGELWLCQF